MSTLWQDVVYGIRTMAGKPGFALAAILSLALGIGAFAQTGGVVEVTAVNSVTGAGVAGAEVRVFHAGGFAAGATDAAGMFRFENLMPGDYRWNVTHPGYLPHPSAGREVVRVDGREAVRLRIVLTPPASLSGRVLDRGGNPVGGARVGFGPGRQANTSADGSFTLTGLRPGTYTLLAAPEQSDVAVIDGQRTVAVPTFYPFVTDPSQAAKIAISAGANLSGFEIRLQSAPVYRVRGRVLDAEGKPAPRARVMLGDSNPYGSMSFAGDSFTLVDRAEAPLGLAAEPVIADEAGRFELPAVQRGDWRVTASSEPVYDAARHRDFSLSGGAQVLVAGRDVEDLEIRLVPPFDWTGSIAWVDVPRESRSIGALLLLSVEAGAGGAAVLQPDGTLRVQNLTPGRYRFLGRWPGERTYVASILVGSNDVTRQPFELNAATPPFRVVVRNDAGSVRGTVDGGVSATVVLLPRGFEAFDLALYAQAGPGGAFEIRGVPPGSHLAFPLAAFEAEDADIALFRTLAARATGVRVDPSGTAFLQLRAIQR